MNQTGEPARPISPRRPNGIKLLTESDKGRVLEVTRAGKTVWEFHNPHQADGSNELVAALFEAVRINENLFRWLKAGRAD